MIAWEIIKDKVFGQFGPELRYISSIKPPRCIVQSDTLCHDVRGHLERSKILVLCHRNFQMYRGHVESVRGQFEDVASVSQ